MCQSLGISGFCCPPHLSSEANLATLREKMATWLQKNVGEGYFLRVCGSPDWDAGNQHRIDTYDVLEIEQNTRGLYRLLPMVVALAKNALKLDNPPRHNQNFHLRIKEVDFLGRAPSGDPDDGFWTSGQAPRSTGVAVPNRYSRTWSCP